MVFMKASKIPPITPARWLENLLEVSGEIANQEHQELRWTANDRYAWETPDELICSIFDDCVFEGFLEQFNDTSSEEQRRTALAFRDSMNSWTENNPGFADNAKTLRDAQWEAVRKSARAFICAFTGQWPARYPKV